MPNQEGPKPKQGDYPTMGAFTAALREWRASPPQVKKGRKSSGAAEVQGPEYSKAYNQAKNRSPNAGEAIWKAAGQRAQGQSGTYTTKEGAAAIRAAAAKKGNP